DRCTPRPQRGSPVCAADRRQPRRPRAGADAAGNHGLELLAALRARAGPPAPPLCLRRRLDAGSRRGSVWGCEWTGVGDTGPHPPTTTPIPPHFHTAVRGPRTPQRLGRQVARRGPTGGRGGALPPAGNGARIRLGRAPEPRRARGRAGPAPALLPPA